MFTFSTTGNRFKVSIAEFTTDRRGKRNDDLCPLVAVYKRDVQTGVDIVSVGDFFEGFIGIMKSCFSKRRIIRGSSRDLHHQVHHFL